MADPTIRIIVEAMTRAAERQLRELQGTVKETGLEGEKAGGRFDKFKKDLEALGKITTPLNQGLELVRKGLQGLKQAWEFGKEGAAIAQTTESWDRLLASMGAAPDTLQKMRDASRGTVDDMTIMSSTLTLLAGTSEELGSAMVDAAPRLMEIAKAAHKLNPALGDTTFMYESLARGIKRSSPLILDNLGLVIKIGAAEEEYARQIGKTVEELTGEEKQMALLEDALRAGDRMIEQVGGHTGEAGDSFAELEVSLKNATDQIKMGATPAILDLLAVVERLVNPLSEASDGASMFDKALRIAVNAMPGYLQNIIKLGSQLRENATEEEKAATATKRHDAIYAAYSQRLLAGVAAYKESQRAAEDAADGQENLGRAIQGITDAAYYAELGVKILAGQEQAAADAADNFKDSLDLLHDAIRGDVGKAIDEYGSKMDELKGTLAELEIKEESLSKQPLVSDSQKDQLADLRADIGETTGKLAEAKDEYAKLLAEGADEEKLAKAQENIDAWQGKLDELNTTVGRTWRDINSTTASELADVQQGILDTTAAIDEETAAFERNIKMVIFDIAQKQILDALEKGLIEDTNNSGTAYDEAALALAGLAEALGIVDEGTQAVTEYVQDQTQAFIDGKMDLDDWTTGMDAFGDRLGDAALSGKDVKDMIDNLPTYKKVNIDVTTTYTNVGTPGHIPGNEPQLMQHGGPVRAGAAYLVGEAGPELFVPRQGGYIVPNSNTTNNNYNLTIHTSATAESALSDFNTMRALAGV